MTMEDRRVLRDTVSIAQAGARAGVSRRTIYNWIKTGKVEHIRTAGGAVRIFADTLWHDPPATEPDEDTA